MSDELAQDEEDAEDYDMEALERRTGARMDDDEYDDDDDATLVGRRGPTSLAEDEVVFEIGDEDGQDSDDENAHKRRPERHNPTRGLEHEEEGLMRRDE